MPICKCTKMDRSRLKWTKVNTNESKWSKWTEVNTQMDQMEHSGPNGQNRTELEQGGLHRT